MLLVIEEIPIFLKRMAQRDGNPGRIDGWRFPELAARRDPGSRRGVAGRNRLRFGLWRPQQGVALDRRRARKTNARHTPQHPVRPP